MRIFLIWGARYDEIEPVITGLQERHQIVYWVGLPGNKTELPGTIFHDHYKAWDGVPAPGLDINQFPPPGKDLLERFYKTESIILTMMNKRYDDRCVDERRHKYYDMFRYWHGVIKRYQPEAIIFPVVPHTVYNYLIYELAKYFGIKTVMMDKSRVPDRLILYTDWRQGCLPLKREMAKNQGRNFTLEDLESNSREYYKEQTNVARDHTPKDMKEWQSKFSRTKVLWTKMKILWRCIKKGTVFVRLGRYIARQFKSNLKKEYSQLQIKPDWHRPFVYVALHYQPELTTCPLGDIFTDQVFIVETIAASLPKEWSIYVKEHPAQWWLRSGIRYSSNRYPNYYQRMAQLKNVFLVPIETDTFELINKSKAVATVTGTAGWEALLRSKPALIFGYPWYRDCPGVFRIKDTEGCKTALQKLVDGYVVRQQEIINYLKSFEQVAVHGYFESFLYKYSKLTPHQNLVNRLQAFLAAIENYEHYDQ